MASNPYDQEYMKTSNSLNNYEGDLDDLVLDPEAYEDDGAYGLDNLHYSTLEDELDPITAAAEEPMALDFGEATDLKEGPTSAYDAKVDADFDKAFQMFNPMAVDAAINESTFTVPEPIEGTTSLGEYVKTIEESYNAYINKKLEKYSK